MLHPTHTVMSELRNLKSLLEQEGKYRMVFKFVAAITNCFIWLPAATIRIRPLTMYKLLRSIRQLDDFMSNPTTWISIRRNHFDSSRRIRCHNETTFFDAFDIAAQLLMHAQRQAAEEKQVLYMSYR